MRDVISSDYIVHLQEYDVDIDLMEDDPITFQQAIQGSKFKGWINAMNVEIKSMINNDVWDVT